MKKSPPFLAVAVAALAAACSSSAAPYGADGGDAGAAKTIVINELFAGGTGPATPDWIELKNVSAAAVDLGGYQIRDKTLADLTSLPAGTTLDPGAYLIVYCDDLADGGVAGGIHVGWKLSGSKGDEVHLLDQGGTEVDATALSAGLPVDKSWGRLPDGTGGFVRTTPTQGQANL